MTCDASELMNYSIRKCQLTFIQEYTPYVMLYVHCTGNKICIEIRIPTVSVTPGISTQVIMVYLFDFGVYDKKDELVFLVTL